MINMKTHYFFIIFAFFIVKIPVYSQSSDQNYILTRTYTADDASTYLDQIQYLDGLGRSVETVQVGITPSRNDLVTYQEYDGFGRESNVWLPGAISGNGAFQELANVKSASQSTNKDASPYSYPVYEASPLNRVLQQFGSGQSWHANGKAINTAYLTNNSTYPCMQFEVGTDEVVNKGNYPDGSLYVTRTMDEDGHELFEFKNKLGQIILTRQINNNHNCDTYYVYDDFGNKCFVLPPSVTSGLKDGVGLDNVLQRFGYIYRYDSRNRCIYKKLPGTDPIYMIYDKADRLIFSQDGEQRKKTPQEWSFNIPDVIGRIVLTGVCTNSLTYTADPLKDIVVKADTTNNFYKGYNVNISLSSSTVLTANYYDGYGFMSRYGGPLISNPNFSIDPNTDYGKQYTGGYKGLLTGKATALLDGSGYLYNVMYYDYMGRVIQTKATNHLTGGYDKDYFLYTFTGKIKKHQHVQSAQGKASITEVYENFYDNAERLTKTTHSLNGSTPVILAENTYDDMGRLISKKQHGAVETTNYTYNIRSWLKGITTTNNRFSETLYYNESTNGSIKCYNGNIGAMNWIVQNDTQRGYNFHYDDLSRITAADYQNNDVNSSKNYSTTYTYDNMGNIKSLTRYGLSAKPSTFGMIDNLTLNYNGNQLSSVTDASTSEPSYTGAFNFVKASVGTPEYTYDANGNLTRDSHKKIAKIQYNILNLPSALQFTEGHTSEYLYDAAGVKRKVKQVTTTENLLVPMGSMLPVPADKVAVTTQTDYCGNVIYENGALNRILVDGGYITMSGTTPTYHYYIQDHQGNNRVVFNQNGTIEQANHYYPFGMTFGEGIDNSDNRYKYNGKELDRMHGLDLYDYGARHYDAAIGRWGVIDPLAEINVSISPYVYCSNNPINRVDPDGRDDYGLDSSTKRLSLVKRTDDKTDFVSTGAFDKDGKFTSNDEPNSFIQISKGVLNAKDDKQDLSKEGFVTTNENQTDGVNLMQFVSSQTGVELDGKGFNTKEGKSELIVGNWDANTTDKSHTTKFNIEGTVTFEIHTHPTGNNSGFGYGIASDNDLNKNPKYPAYYILSQRNGLTQYFPARGRVKTRKNNYTVYPTLNSLPNSLKNHLRVQKK